ncbi:hypothetical protein HZC30_00080 [Candidatus Woesearchaeota archaeon]|nr:hypothetical protein [Candidatus Woesearchaeota archaeon]
MKLHLGIMGILMGILLVLLATMAVAEVKLSGELIIPVNYNNLNDKDKYFEFKDYLISLTTDAAAAENVSLDLTELISNDYKKGDFTLNGAAFPTTVLVSPNATTTVKLSGKIPAGLDPGNTSFGKLTIAGKPSTLNAKVEPMLKLKNIGVFINGLKEKTLKDEGDKIPDLTPGDEVELRFSLDNGFDKDYDYGDIEDGTITVQLDDSDFGKEIDEEIDFGLGAGDDFGESDAPAVNFTVPTDADEGDYTLEIIIKADDENNADYEIKWDVEFSVERKKDDVRIEEMKLLPSEVSCSRKFTLSTKVTNYGSDSQKYAALSLISSELGIDQKFDFSLDSGTSKNNFVVKEYSGEAKADLAPGTYAITGKAFYDYTTISDLLEAKLVVKECIKPTATPNITANASTDNAGVITSTINLETKGTTPPATTAPTTATPAATDANQLSSAVIAQTIESPYSADDYILAGLVVAIILMLVLIVLFIVVLQR